MSNITGNSCTLRPSLVYYQHLTETDSNYKEVVTKTITAIRDAEPIINGKRKFTEDVATSSNPKKPRTISLVPKVSQTSKDIEEAIENLITNTHLLHQESDINLIFNTFYKSIKKYTPLESIYIEKLIPVLNNIIANINNKNLSANQCVTIIHVLPCLRIFDSRYDNDNYTKISSILLHKILQLAITSYSDKNHNIIKTLCCLKNILHQNHLLFTSKSMIALLQEALKEISISSLDCKPCIELLSALSYFIAFNILPITSNNKNIINSILEQLKLYKNNIHQNDLKKLKTTLFHLAKIQELKPIIANYSDIFVK